MTHPKDIVAAFVQALRDISGLVTLLGDNDERIYGYDDRYPLNVNLPRAIHKMPSPSVMVAYQNYGPGEMGLGQPIKHKLTIYVRPGDGVSCFDIGVYLVDGIPTGQPLVMQSLTVHANLDPMVLEGDYDRQEDAEGVEYWYLPISYNEKWG